MTDIEAGVEDAEPTWRFWSKMLFIKHDCHNEAPTTTINKLAFLEVFFIGLTSVLQLQLQK